MATFVESFALRNYADSRPIMVQRANCRLCTGVARFRFRLTVLRKYEVSYFECETCGSLQTDLPHWIAEAYSDCSLSRLDTGAAQRNIQNLAACYSIAKIFRARNVLDVGGGDGLLCRLLRDYEINCFVSDKYANLTYAQGYSEATFSTPDMVVGFEVLEHFPEPSSEVDQLFARDPGVLLLSTSIYSGQGEDWWYLAPESGQHVFFYSRTALEWIGRRHGFDVLISGAYILFARGFSSVRLGLAKAALSGRGLRWSKAWLVTRPTPGVWKDHVAQVDTLKNRT